MKENSSSDFLWIAILGSIPGYFGVFGLGHVYQARWRRGLAWFLLGLATVFTPWVLRMKGLVSGRLAICLFAFGIVTLLWNIGDALQIAGIDLSLEFEPTTIGAYPTFAIFIIVLPAALESAYWLCGSRSQFVDDAIYLIASWLALLLLVIVVIRSNLAVRSVFGWKNFLAIDLAWAALGIFLVKSLLSYLEGSLIVLTRLPIYPFGFSNGPGIGDLLLGTICNVLTPAIVEESFFRAYLIRYFRVRGSSTLASALLAMVTFALIHVPHQGAGRG